MIFDSAYISVPLRVIDISYGVEVVRVKDKVKLFTKLTSVINSVDEFMISETSPDAVDHPSISLVYSSSCPPDRDWETILLYL